MHAENTNWGQSVTGVLIHGGKVLLGRHTYGPGKNMLIVPGGYVNINETPQQAVVREYQEETGITVEPVDVIAIRFNMKDWYVAFSLRYLSGTATPDWEENSEVVWVDIDEALQRSDVPDLTKKLIECAVNEHPALTRTEYSSREHHGTFSLYSK